MAIIGFVTLIGAPQTVRADSDEHTSDSVVEAEGHLRKGLELRKELRDVEALAEFQAAYGLAPTGHARAQIALAEQALGHWAAAESDLTASLKSNDPWVATHRATLEQALGFVATHLGWLDVDSNVQGAEVSVNGNVVGRTPLSHPMRVVAGSVLIHLEADGYLPTERAVVIEAAERARELVELVARPPAAPEAPLERPGPPARPAPPVPESPRSESVSLPGAALVGAGIVALGVGGFFGVRTFADKGARDQHCAGNACDPAGLAFDRDAHRDALVSTVGFGIGAALAAGGAFLLLRRHDAQVGSVRVNVASGGYGAGLSVGGAW